MKHKISIPCEKSNLQRIRTFVIEVLRDQNLSELDVHSMVLAVDEVCANMMIHSNHCSPDHSIEVIIMTNDKNKVIFDIIDKGSGFDIRDFPEPDISEIIKMKKKGGVGLMLVKRIMDEIDFIRKDKNSIVRLTKNLETTG
ncbi:MAG: ATP-binding protein [Bacteroidota bacterium]